MRFFVPGKPEPKGSLRGYTVPRGTGRPGVRLTPTNQKKLGPWVGAVYAAAMVARPAGMVLPTFANVAVTVRLLFGLPRPKAHYRTGKFSGILRADAPIHHTNKPDKDKLTRAIFDALRGVVYDDDCRVDQGPTTKVWCPPDCLPGVLIDIRATRPEEVIDEQRTFREASRVAMDIGAPADEGGLRRETEALPLGELPLPFDDGRE